MSWPLIGRETQLASGWELLRSGRGFALLGAAGVGKSRLLKELLNRAEDHGIATFRAFATESTRTVPFGPFVELLPTSQTQDRLQLLRMVIDALVTQSHGPLIIGVDDGHQLDDGSLALLAKIASSRAATLAVTARVDPPLPTGLVALWKDDWIERLNLDALSAEDTRELGRAVLGTVDAELETELWRFTQGNPLFLHELIEGAKDRTIVQNQSGVWHLTGSLADSARFADVLENRLSGMSEELRAALELVAIGAPLPHSVLAAAGDPQLVTTLERLRLVSVTVLDEDLMLRPTHPLYGEVLVTHMGEARRREANRQLAAAAHSTGLRPPLDALRVAMWQRDSGRIDDLSLALEGATIALSRHEASLAEELVRPVFDKSQAAEPSVVLGLGLSYQRRYEEAEDVLGSAEPDDESTAVAIASARARNLAFGLSRIAEAIQVLAEAAAGVRNDALKGRLDSERGMIAAIPGGFSETFSASRAVLENPSASGVARASAHASLSLAQAMTGDCHGFFDYAEAGLEIARACRTELPLAEDQILIMQVNALLASGRVSEALELARNQYVGLEPTSMMKSTWVAQLGLALEQAGQLVGARDALEHSLTLVADSDPFRLERQMVGLVAFVAGELGNPEPSRRIDDLRHAVPEPRIDIWVDRGRAWGAVAAGDVATGAELSVSGGAAALERQHVTWGAMELHDSVRLGRPELALDLLHQATGGVRGADLVTNMRDHAEGLAGRDTEQLMAVAQRFGAFGCPLLAAEVSAQCARILETRREPQPTARAVVLSMCWEEQTQNAKTPALANRPDVVSRREIQMATSAASGSSSHQIAADQYISVRTVDNHLGAVYRKLGIGGRDELSGLLGPALGRATSDPL